MGVCRIVIIFLVFLLKKLSGKKKQLNEKHKNDEKN